MTIDKPPIVVAWLQGENVPGIPNISSVTQPESALASRQNRGNTTPENRPLGDMDPTPEYTLNRYPVYLQIDSRATPDIATSIWTSNDPRAGPSDRTLIVCNDTPQITDFLPDNPWRTNRESTSQPHGLCEQGPSPRTYAEKRVERDRL